MSDISENQTVPSTGFQTNIFHAYNLGYIIISHPNITKVMTSVRCEECACEAAWYEAPKSTIMVCSISTSLIKHNDYINISCNCIYLFLFLLLFFVIFLLIFELSAFTSQMPKSVTMITMFIYSGLWFSSGSISVEVRTEVTALASSLSFFPLWSKCILPS